MAEQQQGSVATGCFGLIILFGVASCVFGGSHEKETVAPTVASEAPTTAPVRASAAVPKSGSAGAQKSVKPKKAGRIMIDDLDDAEKAIRLTINLSGRLCAKPIEVQQVNSELFGVRCVLNRDGSGVANYHVNSRTNTVSDI